MSGRRWGAAMLVLLALGAPGAVRAQAEPPAAAAVPLPAWLAGSWRTVRGTITIEEQWSEPLGGVMLATGRTTQDELLVEFEFLRIVQRDGTLVYMAQPGGASPTEFALTAAGPDSVRFENAANDFPKVIRYLRLGADRVEAAISGPAKAGERVIRFDYRRAGVAAPTPGAR